jgi:outer membrane protein OmpA-like peptidoglycan-associated protein
MLLLLLLLLRQCKPSKPEIAKAPPAVITVEEKFIPPESIEPPVKAPVFWETDEAIFVGNSSELLPNALKWLDETAGKMRQELLRNPEQTFKVIGYAAVLPGPPDPNELSLRRAAKIIEELAGRFIPRENMEPAAGGETSQWGDNTSEETRFNNRRARIMMAD